MIDETNSKIVKTSLELLQKLQQDKENQQSGHSTPTSSNLPFFNNSQSSSSVDANTRIVKTSLELLAKLHGTNNIQKVSPDSKINPVINTAPIKLNHMSHTPVVSHSEPKSSEWTDEKVKTMLTGCFFKKFILFPDKSQHIFL